MPPCLAGFFTAAVFETGSCYAMFVSAGFKLTM